MKRIFIFIISLFLIITGCGKKGGTNNDGDGETELNPPTNLTVAVEGSDSLSLRLNWVASTTSGVEKYLVYFNTTDIAEVDSTSYIDTPGSLGDYKVKAYKNGKTSASSNIVSTQIVGDSAQGPIYTVTDPQGYGWDSTGNGETYNIGTAGNRQNTDKVDFILDNLANIRNPHNFDSQFQHTSLIARKPDWLSDTYDTLSIAPSKGDFGEQQSLVSSGTYVFWIHNKYYVKLNAFHDVMGDSATFKYCFQTIPGFRRFK